MAEDKLIKSGQFTLARLLFLAGSGALIFAFVYLGGDFLKIGYLLLTAIICVLLYLVAVDYGVSMDTVDTTVKSPSLPLESALATGPASEAVKAKKRSSKTVKRRR
jgi:hypothetical protein